MLVASTAGAEPRPEWDAAVGVQLMSALSSSSQGGFGAIEYRAIGDLWVHGHLGFGAEKTIDAGDAGHSGSYTTVRAGGEFRPELGDAFAFVAGADVGVRVLGGDVAPQYDSTSFLAIARLGFEAGTRELRVRPMVEAAVGPRHPEFSISGAIAYRW